MKRIKLIRKLLICALLCVNPCLVFAQGPEILKVDPPSWWPLTQLNPVRLMIRGRNLQGARVKLIGPGIDLGNTRTNDRGIQSIRLPQLAAPLLPAHGNKLSMATDSRGRAGVL